jgi:diguanylate cyclase (GGDEF)-like protein
MAVKRPLEEDSPAEVRRQLSKQLRIDSWKLARIDADGLYRLRDQLAVDELTGVLRRRAGLAGLEREVERARRSGDRKLVVAFVDVDDLKAINDLRGHAAGDEALRKVAGVLKRRLRSQDLIFRYGGDEFVCVLPNAGIEAAQALMLQIWQHLAEESAPSFSVGLADLRDEDDVQVLISRADECLYAGTQRRRQNSTAGLMDRLRPPSGTYALRRARAAPPGPRPPPDDLSALGHLAPANILPVRLSRSTADRLREYRPVVEHRLAQCFRSVRAFTLNAAASLPDRFRELVVLHWTAPLAEQREDKRIGLLNRFSGGVDESSGDPVP